MIQSNETKSITMYKSDRHLALFDTKQASKGAEIDYVIKIWNIHSFNFDTFP